MSWSTSFVDDLVRPPAPVVFAVRTLEVADELTYRGPYIASTDPRFGDPVLNGPPACTGASLSLDSITATMGGWSFEVCGDIQFLREAIVRGTCVEILMGFGTYNVGDLERVGLGRVDNVRFDGRVCVLSILDPSSLLDGRWVAAGDEGDLFWDLRPSERPSTTLDVGYTAGDTTVDVAATAGFPYETSGNGVILLGTHALTFTGTTAGTFTGCSTVGRFLTTAADVAAAESVYPAAYLYGNPLGIARKVLVSTGAGTNGAWDLYPASWGYGLPAEFVDMDDIAEEADQIVTCDPDVYKVELLVTEPVTDPRGWFTGWLAKVGCFLSMRQGLITVRGLTGSTSRHREATAAFTDADIIPGTIRSEWFDSGRAKEYGKTDVYYGTSTTPLDSPVKVFNTLPGGVDKPVDLSTLLYNEDGYADAGSVMTEVHNRIYMFAKWIGEVISFDVGLVGMTVAVGDYVTLRTACPYLRYGYNRDGFDLEVLVVQVSPDYRRGICSIRVVNQFDVYSEEP